MGRATEMISFINDFNNNINTSSYHSIDTKKYSKQKQSYASFYKRLNTHSDNVYLIGNLEQGIVKIGKSDCIKLRLVQIQTYCHFELSILKTTTNLLEKEEELHKRFKDYKVRGEWFKIEGELEKYINEPNWRENNS